MNANETGPRSTLSASRNSPETVPNAGDVRLFRHGKVNSKRRFRLFTRQPLRPTEDKLQKSPEQQRPGAGPAADHVDIAPGCDDPLHLGRNHLRPPHETDGPESPSLTLSEDRPSHVIWLTNPAPPQPRADQDHWRQCFLNALNGRDRGRRVGWLSSEIDRRTPVRRSGTRRLVDLSRSNTARAGLDVLRSSVDHCPDPLQIRQPASLGDVVSVRNVVAGHWPLAADIASLRHDRPPRTPRIGARFNNIISDIYQGAEVAEGVGGSGLQPDIMRETRPRPLRRSTSIIPLSPSSRSMIR